MDRNFVRICSRCGCFLRYVDAIINHGFVYVVISDRICEIMFMSVNVNKTNWPRRTLISNISDLKGEAHETQSFPRISSGFFSMTFILKVVNGSILRLILSPSTLYFTERSWMWKSQKAYSRQ